MAGNDHEGIGRLRIVDRAILLLFIGIFLALAPIILTLALDK